MAKQLKSAARHLYDAVAMSHYFKAEATAIESIDELFRNK